MTLGGKEDGTGGLNIQWPLIAVFATLLISMVTGAIQLGSVQTHVQVNTGRLDLLESREREDSRNNTDARERMTRVEAAFTGYQKRLDAMEERHMRLFDALNARLDRLESRLVILEQGFLSHRSKSVYDRPFDGTPESRNGQRSPP
jgi:predicted nuclease with TOPRIM domain